jgi:hypothetical protein
VEECGGCAGKATADAAETEEPVVAQIGTAACSIPIECKACKQAPHGSDWCLDPEASKWLPRLRWQASD